MASIDRVMALADEINKKKKKKDYEINTSIVNVNDIANEMQRGNTKAIKEFNYNPNNFVIKNNGNEKKWYQEILQVPEVFKGNLDRFDDGYQKGDVIKTGGEIIGDTLLTIGGTAADLGLGVIKGILNVGEGIGDAISYGGAQVLDWVGKDEKADEIRERASKDIFNEAFKKPQSFVNKASIIGDTGDKVSEGIGYMASIWASGYIGGAAGTAVSGGTKAAQIGSTIGQSSLIFTNSTGTNMADIYEQYGVDGVTDGEAWGKSLGNAAIETTTEQLLGMFGNVDTRVVNAMSNRAKTALGSVLTRAGIQAFDEGLEEIISFAGNHVWDRIVDAASKGEGATFAQEVSWEEMWEQAGIAAITALSMGGGQTSASVLNNKTSNNTWGNALSETAKQQNASAQIEDLNDEISKINKQIKKTTDTTQLQELQNELAWKQKQLNSLQEQNTAPIENTTEQNNREEVLSTIDEEKQKELKNVLSRNGTFSEQVDKYIARKLPSGDFLYLGETPAVLQTLGVPNNEIILKQNKLKTLMEESNNNTDKLHGISVETIKKLPEAIARPLNVLKSSTNENSVVIITELADTYERPIIVSIEVDYDGQIGKIKFLSNRLTSAYGKNNYDRFMKTEIAKGNLLYDIDEGIIKELPATRLQSPKGISSSVDTNNNVSTSNNSITSQNENVNHSNKYAQQEQKNTQNKDNVTTGEKNTAPVEEQQNEDALDTSEEAREQEEYERHTGFEIEEQDNGEKITNILSNLPKDIPESRVKEYLEKAGIKIIDKGFTVKNEALKYKNQTLEEDYNQIKHASREAVNMVMDGYTDWDIDLTQKRRNGRIKSNKITKSIEEMMYPIKNTNQTANFYDYMYNQLNIDRMTLEDRYGTKNKTLLNISAENSQENIKKYKGSTDFKTAEEDVRTYINQLQNILVEAGILSEEQKAHLNEMYPHYIPAYRNIGKQVVNANYFNNSIKANDAVGKAKGGTQDILPLDHSLMVKTKQVIHAARVNKYLQNLKNTYKQNGVLNVISSENLNETDTFEESTSTERVNKTKDGKYTATVYENGQKTTFEISMGQYEALKPSDIPVITTLNTFIDIKRSLLTEYNLYFATRNITRDLPTAFLQSQNSLKWLSNVPEAVMQVAKKGQYYQLAQSLGAGNNSYADMNKIGYADIAPIDTNQENKGNKFSRGWQAIKDWKGVKWISTVNNFIEQVPRMAEFITAIDSGKSGAGAIYAQDEVTVNFGKGGDWTKALDRNITNFVNANIQGGYKIANVFRDAYAYGGTKGLAKVIAKYAIAGGSMVALMGAIWDDDEDYEELSDYIKQNYYIIGKYDNGKFVKIPKGRTNAVIEQMFSSGASVMKGEKTVKEAVSNLMTVIENNLAPNSLIESSIFAAIYQTLTNTSWYGEDIVPTRLQKEEAKDQYDETTDAFSIWLGQTFGISPYKANYLLDQSTGFLGDIILPLLTEQAETPIDNSVAEMFLGQFYKDYTTDSTMKNQYVTDIFSLTEEGSDLYVDANKTNAKDEDILKYKYLTLVTASMNKLYAEKRLIQNEEGLSNSEKISALRDIQRQIDDMAKEALKNYKKVKKTSNYATVGNKEYYLKDDTWAKVENDELAELKSLNMSIKDKSTYFKLKDEINNIKISDVEYKKAQIATVVKNTNLTDEQKAYVYGKYYASDETLDMIINSGISFNEYLNYASQEFVADKDSNGKSINGSRKTKVIKYINSLQLSIPQKAMLIRTEYSTFDSYNKEIIEYVNNLKIDYTEKISILEGLGMKIDNGKVTW